MVDHFGEMGDVAFKVLAEYRNSRGKQKDGRSRNGQR
jgi:hypothetical protein